MNDDQCPKCNSNNIKKGSLGTGIKFVLMFSYDNPKNKSSKITSYYCSNCGYILSSNLENPSNLD
ncbi:PF20097 family protein [Peribacillus simplex]|nr:PF20097 family protein [Peribacillus simplex]WHY58300.1 PF20097 family protein [Peribacillus simplex]